MALRYQYARLPYAMVYRDQEHPFQTELRDAVGARLKRDPAFARALYRALANVRWQKADGSRPDFMVSSRLAAAVVAQFAPAGTDYLEFLGLGDEGQVSREIALLLQTLGWRPAPGLQAPAPAPVTVADARQTTHGRR